MEIRMAYYSGNSWVAVLPKRWVEELLDKGWERHLLVEQEDGKLVLRPLFFDKRGPA